VGAPASTGPPATTATGGTPAAPPADPTPGGRLSQALRPQGASDSQSDLVQDPRLDQFPPDVRLLVANEAARAKPYCENNVTLMNFYECSCFARKTLDTRVQVGAQIIYAAAGEAGLSPQFGVLIGKMDLSSCVSEPAIAHYAHERANGTLRLTSQAQLKSVGDCVAQNMYAAFKQKPLPNIVYVDGLFTTALSACYSPGQGQQAPPRNTQGTPRAASGLAAAPASAGPPATTVTAETSRPDGGALPLTQYRAKLLLLRDVPQVATDEALLPYVVEQIRAEAQTWQVFDNIIKENASQSSRGITPRFQLNPTRSSFIFEWQKYVDQQPDMARGVLLDVFLRPDADWSFVKREHGWDDHFDNIIEVFLFSRDKIVGRDPQFAARELLPVVRRHLEAAAAKATTKFWFDVRLPGIGYDFSISAFRFVKPGTFRTAGGKYEFVDKINILNPVDFGKNFPVETRSMASYSTLSPTATANAQLTDDTPSSKPAWHSGGIPGTPVPDVWRDKFNTWARLPSLLALSLNHQLQLVSVPVDPARAEVLTKKNVGFTARIYIEADHAYTFDNGSNKAILLAARIQKVDILASNPYRPGDELVATFGPDGLPAPAAPATVAPTKPANQPPPQKSTFKNKWTE
jgi:hypothetical protein